MFNFSFVILSRGNSLKKIFLWGALPPKKFQKVLSLHNIHICRLTMQASSQWFFKCTNYIHILAVKKLLILKAVLVALVSEKIKNKTRWQIELI